MLRESITPPGGFLYWAAFILYSLILMAALRLLFLLHHRELVHKIAGNDILTAFLVGGRFDLTVICPLIFLFYLISFIYPVGFWSSRLAARALRIILYAVFSLAILLCVIDIEYYTSFGDHLGVWFYSYMDNFDLVWYSLPGGGHLAWYLFLWVTLTAGFVAGATTLVRIGQARTRTGRIVSAIYFILGIILLAIGARGGISLAPLDWGGSYFSNSSFANDLSLNGVFTLTRSFYESYDDAKRDGAAKYRYMSRDEAMETVQKTVVAPLDSLIEPGKSLKRISNFPRNDSTSYNVIIVILESWSAKFVGTLGGTPGVTPYFDSLAEKSLLFANFYASGLRTNRGLLSVLCSFPSLPGRTVMKRYGAPHPFMSIAQILAPRNYDSFFIYGGDLGFDNMGGFFRGEGFAHMTGIEDFPKSARLNKWGVPDHIVLERANTMFASAAQPFLGAVVTLSNHEPFVLPGKEFEVFPKSVKNYEYLNTFHYSDWSLGHFFHLAEKENYYNNTIFVLVGDHGKIMGRPDDMRGNFRIAGLIYCPGRRDIVPARIEIPCGQVDLAPTILALLGGPARHESWGRNILDRVPNDGYAFLNKDDSYAWIEDSLMVYDKPGARPIFSKFDPAIGDFTELAADSSNIVTLLQQRGRAMLQLEVEMVHPAWDDVKGRAKKPE